MKTDIRVTLTKRLLKEGLLHELRKTPISKITIIDLCDTAGVNRATFYKHYGSPTMILKEIAQDYATRLEEIFKDSMEETQNRGDAIIACLTFLSERKAEIKLLFSKNAENQMSGFGLEIVNDFVASHRMELRKMFSGNDDDNYMFAILISSAAFGLLQTWLVKDIDKTPEEILAILKGTLTKSFL